MTAITGCHFILYVRDQQRSRVFYEAVLGRSPRLNVPGMTEFDLGDGAILGLMPQAGIKRLLGAALPDPADAAGIPRSELYLLVDDVNTFHGNALTAGAAELSPPAPRDWGHVVGYLLDLDGHVIAFARASREPGA